MQRRCCEAMDRATGVPDARGAQVAQLAGNVGSCLGADRQRNDRKASHRHDADVSGATPNVTRRGARRGWHGPASQQSQYFSAVAGSMMFLISEILFAGKPPSCACLRTISSFGAMYTQ